MHIPLRYMHRWRTSRACMMFRIFLHKLHEQYSISQMNKNICFFVNCVLVTFKCTLKVEGGQILDACCFPLHAWCCDVLQFVPHDPCNNGIFHATIKFLHINKMTSLKRVTFYCGSGVIITVENFQQNCYRLISFIIVFSLDMLIGSGSPILAP